MSSSSAQNGSLQTADGTAGRSSWERVAGEIIGAALALVFMLLLIALLDLNAEITLLSGIFVYVALINARLSRRERPHLKA